MANNEAVFRVVRDALADSDSLHDVLEDVGAAVLSYTEAMDEADDLDALKDEANMAVPSAHRLMGTLLDARSAWVRAGRAREYALNGREGEIRAWIEEHEALKALVPERTELVDPDVMRRTVTLSYEVDRHLASDGDPDDRVQVIADWMVRNGFPSNYGEGANLGAEEKCAGGCVCTPAERTEMGLD